MEQDKDVRILIVDYESQFCKLLEAMASPLGMKIESTAHPLAVVNRTARAHFDVILLDVRMCKINGPDLVSNIAGRYSDAKIIVLADNATKGVAIEALKQGAFDLLEKPFDADLLLYTIRRALDVQSAERKAKRMTEELEGAGRDLAASRQQVQDLSNRLMETNKALALLAQNIEMERSEMEKRIVVELKSLIFPILDKIRHDSGLVKYKADLDILMEHIGRMTSSFSTDAQVIAVLSPTELRIASLVKSGLTSNDIAEQLNISPATVRTHRKNIRKKLKINSAGFNLKHFLLCKQHPLMSSNSDRK